jgi:hypothetical protein
MARKPTLIHEWRVSIIREPARRFRLIVVPVE